MMKVSLFLPFFLFASAMFALPANGPWRIVERSFLLLKKRESTADQFVVCFLPDQRKEAGQLFAAMKKNPRKMEIYRETAAGELCTVYCREKDIPFSDTVICLKKQKNEDWFIDLAETRRKSAGTPAAMKIKCADNLKRLGILLMSYASENGGKFPDSFQQISFPAIYDSRKKVGKEELSHLFRCPAGKKTYCYRSGVTEDSTVPIVWCSHHIVHKTGICLMLLSDGRVEFGAVPRSEQKQDGRKEQ